MKRIQFGLNRRGVCLSIVTATLLCFFSPVSRAQAPAGDRSYQMIISGSGPDVATSVVLGEHGDVYVTGVTSPDEFPATAGAYDDGGPYERFFVTRFHPDGTIAFTAYLSGGRGEALAVDASGIYVAGIEGRPEKAFVAKLSLDGSTLVYRTLPLGPVAAAGADWFAPPPRSRLSIAVAADGTAHVGGTAVAGFAATAGAFDTTLDGPSDGFIATVDPQGTLTSKTFLGGSSGDWINGLVVDPVSGDIIVTGDTYSTDFPVTANTLAPAADGGAFVARFSGTTLNFSSVLGHNSSARKVVLGSTGPSGPAPGSVWITGVTSDTAFPVTPGAYGHFGSSSDYPRFQTFVMQLSSTGDLLYSSSILPRGYEPGDHGYEVGSARALSLAVLDVPGVKKLFVAGETNTHRSYFDSYDDGFGFELDLVRGRGTYSESLIGPIEEAFYDVAVNRRGDTVFVGLTQSHATAAEMYWSGAIVYGTPVDYPPDEEMRGWIPSDIVIVKRLAPANTPSGTGIVAPVGGAPLTLTFANIVSAGTTTVTPIADPSSLNLTLPGAFRLSHASGAYEISTTASFTGTIEVCFTAPGLSPAEFASASILHGVGGAWQVENTRRDAAAGTLCADVTSLSPFAVGLPSDETAPRIACSPAPAGWQPANVTLSCTASDDGSGLAAAGDASFTLTTSVAPGIETGAATTDSRVICDRQGNCSTAGPLGGILIDLRAPAIQIAAPAARRYLLREAANASYACSDAGSGVASCAGPVASGGAVDTSAVGQRSFVVSAADAAGNAATARVDYAVGFGMKALYDENREYRAGSSVALHVVLIDASGRNSSAADIPVTAQRVTHLGHGSSVDLGYALPFVSKSASYGGKIDTGGLKPGTYEVELTAAGDPAVHRVRFRLK